MSEERIDWLFHCYNNDHADRCLELGSGWGSLSFPLTKFFKEVISVDLISRGLSFQAIRAKQDQVDAIRLAEADVKWLPFRDDQFDLSAANGLLEWIARWRSDDQTPRSAQLTLLKEIRRCLRPGGCLYIGVENRISRWYRGSAPDPPSSKLNILPKRLADYAVRRMLRDWGLGYERSTYSFRGYRDLLVEAGFGTMEFYWAYPSYQFPWKAGKLHDGDSYSFFSKLSESLRPTSKEEDKSLLARLASFLIGNAPPQVLGKLMPYVWPSFLIFAWKDFRPETLEHALAREVGARSLVRVSGSKMQFVALENRKARYYLRFPRFFHNERIEDLENEERLRSEFGGVKITKHTMEGLEFFRESAIGGNRCRLDSMGNNQKAVDWLLKFQSKTSSRPLSDEDAARDEEEMHGGLSRLGLKTLASETLTQTKRMWELLITKSVPTCSEQGDFLYHNIFISNGGEVAVLDWEFYRGLGNPMYDFCFFLADNASYSKRSREDSFILNFSGSGPYSNIISNLVETFCSRTGLPVEAVLAGIPYALSRAVTRFSLHWSTARNADPRHSRLLRVWNEKVQYSDFSWLQH